jgi:hypothetical protein
MSLKNNGFQHLYASVHKEKKAPVVLVQILCFWTLSIVTALSKKHRPAYFFKTQRFGDWILSPSSGKTHSAGPNR